MEAVVRTAAKVGAACNSVACNICRAHAHQRHRGIAAIIPRIGHPIHSHLRAVHGKIGFLMLLLVIGHTIKHRKFFSHRPPLKKCGRAD